MDKQIHQNVMGRQIRMRCIDRQIERKNIVKDEVIPYDCEEEDNENANNMFVQKKILSSKVNILKYSNNKEKTLQQTSNIIRTPQQGLRQTSQASGYISTKVIYYLSEFIFLFFFFHFLVPSVVIVGILWNQQRFLILFNSV